MDNSQLLNKVVEGLDEQGLAIPVVTTIAKILTENEVEFTTESWGDSVVRHCVVKSDAFGGLAVRVDQVVGVEVELDIVKVGDERKFGQVMRVNLDACDDVEESLNIILYGLSGV